MKKSWISLAALIAALALAMPGTAATTPAPAPAKAAAFSWIRATLGAGAPWLPYGSTLYHGSAFVDLVTFLPNSHAQLYTITLQKRAGKWTVVKSSHSAQDCYIGSGHVECSTD